MNNKRWFYQSCNIMVVLRGHVADRLSHTCFRGKHRQLAGNFSAFASFTEVMNDDLVEREFLEQLMIAFDEDAIGYQSFTVDALRVIGWSSTDESGQYASDDLMTFSLNRNATAMRVRLEAAHHRKAPKASTLIFVCELKYEGGRRVAVVHSLYPGDDVGELRGNVSEREKVVFFGWDHPGEL